MDEIPFGFQADSFGHYDENLLSCDDHGYDFRGTQLEQFNFDVAPECFDQEVPGLSPDTSLKNQTNDSPESTGLFTDGNITPTEITSTSRPQKSHARFSKKARSILRTWFLNHIENPYPTPEEKIRLEEETGLQRNQVALWLANARRRNKPRPQYSLPSLSSVDLPEIPEMPSIEQVPEENLAMLMPPPPAPEVLVDTDELAKVTLPSLKPFDRWKIDYRWSQEPAEPQHISKNINDAVGRSPPSVPTWESSAYDDISSNILGNDGTASTSEFDAFWAQSMHSCSTGLTGLASTSMLSDHTALSYQPSTTSTSYLDGRSMNSFEDIKPRRRCKARRAIKERSQGGKFQCTFCKNRAFKTKHDWQRHEKSQHLNIESWACCGFGSGIIETTDGPTCAFCSTSNPSSSHLETHHYSACQGKGLSERTFYRKDHFKQHLVLVHECGYSPQMDIWKVEFPDIVSRCGFCSIQLSSWQERVDHLATHFKAGSKMADWTGELGFEEHITAIIDFGTDFDAKRFDPHRRHSGASSVGTHGSSLEYQAHLGVEIGSEVNPILDDLEIDDVVLDTYVRRSFWCWSSNSSESGKGVDFDNGLTPLQIGPVTTDGKSLG